MKPIWFDTSIQQFKNAPDIQAVAAGTEFDPAANWWTETLAVTKELAWAK